MENNQMNENTQSNQGTNDQTSQSQPSGEGMSKNVAGALAYVLGFISGIYFLSIKKETDSFVRFHAMQSIFFSIAAFVVSLALGFIPLAGLFLAPLFSFGLFLLWIYLMYQAYEGNEFEIPIIGEMARKQL